MHSSKRIIALGAAFAAMTLLAACGDGGDVQETPAADQPAAEQPADQQDGTAPLISADQLPEGVTMAMVEQGDEIFHGVGLCQSCHGPDATGTPLAPDLTDDQWINIGGSYEEIVNLVTTGVPQPVQHPSPMPPMGGADLSQEQVRSVAAYVYALSHGG